MSGPGSYTRSSKAGYKRKFKTRGKHYHDSDTRPWLEQKPREYEGNILSPAVYLKRVAFYDGYNKDSQWDWLFAMRQK